MTHHGVCEKCHRHSKIAMLLRKMVDDDVEGCRKGRLILNINLPLVTVPHHGVCERLWQRVVCLERPHREVG